MPFTSDSDLSKLSAHALIELLYTAMAQADLWHVAHSGRLFRVTATRELLGGQPCGCDPKARHVCEQHTGETTL